MQDAARLVEIVHQQVGEQGAESLVAVSLHDGFGSQHLVSAVARHERLDILRQAHASGRLRNAGDDGHTRLNDGVWREPGQSAVVIHTQYQLGGALLSQRQQGGDDDLLIPGCAALVDELGGCARLPAQVSLQDHVGELHQLVGADLAPYGGCQDAVWVEIVFAVERWHHADGADELGIDAELWHLIRRAG